MMFFPRLIACLAACLLASCIDGHEEIWLEANGSGRAEISYSIPKAAARLYGGEAGLREMIEKFIAENPVIHSSSHQITTEGEQLKIHIRANFDSVLKLKDLVTGPAIESLPSAAAALAGEVKIGLSGRTVDFQRRISLGSALPGIGLLPASKFQDGKLRYTLHLPVPVLESNATRSEKDGHTLIWEVPLATAIRTPITTRCVAKIPIPPWAIAATAPTLFIAGGLAFLGIRRLRKPRSTARSTAVG
jgi:hypothetical protein